MSDIVLYYHIGNDKMRDRNIPGKFIGNIRNPTVLKRINSVVSSVDIISDGLKKRWLTCMRNTL